MVDLDVVRENYLNFAKALPDTKVFYAVKANPAPEILKLLAELGCCFDVASVPETHAALAAGAPSERISYGNTIKKEAEIAAAFALGVTLFAVDCEAEVEKVARAAPGSRVICRILCDGAGAEWPLSRKFGCEPVYAADILEYAHKLGLVPLGVSFHVGSQQHNVEAWDRALASTAAVSRLRRTRHHFVHRQSRRRLSGALCAQDAEARILRKAIFRSLRKHFGNDLPNTIVEPGRGLVGNAGMIEAEVVLIAKRSPEDEVRWVYLDIGKFHGLAETIGESIAIRSAPARTATTRRRASSPARPGTWSTCSTKNAISAAGVARHRRQGDHRGGRRLHGELFVGRLQRLSAAAAIRDLTGSVIARSSDEAIQFCSRGAGLLVALAMTIGYRPKVRIAAGTSRRRMTGVLSASGADFFISKSTSGGQVIAVTLAELFDQRLIAALLFRAGS